MFKSVRIGREGLIAAVCAALCAAIIISISVPLSQRAAEGGSPENRQRFAAEHGWRLGDCVQEEQVVLGTEADGLSRAYEQLLQGQGMSFEPYLGRQVTLYVCEVLNFTSGRAEMHIFEHGGRIIAAHLCAADGCIYGLDGQKFDFYTKYPI